MKHRRRSLCALLTVLVISSASAAEIDVDKLCAKAVQLPLPSQDQPTGAQRQQLDKCDAEDLYYGITRAPDLAAARLCAYTQLEPDQGLIYGGTGILMMIYANAESVPRNLDLARRFACELGGAPAELEGRLQYLDAVQTKRLAPKKWDICDDITSGFMGGACTAHQERFEARARERALAALIKQWTPQERAAFDQLRGTARPFFDLHSREEIDQSGTLRGAQTIEERANQELALLAHLREFEAGKLPTFTADEFRRADAALNATYGKLMKMNTSTSTFSTKALRDTQRLWLKYRESWVAFGAVKYPQVPADAWRTFLTRSREATLREIVETLAIYQ